LGDKLERPIDVSSSFETQIANRARHRVIGALRSAKTAIKRMPLEVQLVICASAAELLEPLVILGALPGEESSKIFAREIRKIIPGFKGLRKIMRGMKKTPTPKAGRTRPRR